MRAPPSGEVVGPAALQDPAAAAEGTLVALLDEAAEAARGLEDLDRAAADAAAAARAHPGAFALQWRASRAFFRAALLRMLRGEVELGRTERRIDVLLEAGEHLPDDLRAALVSLSREGVAFAEAAARLEPGRVEAHLHLGFNLTVLAVAQGGLSALAQGLPGRIRDATERAVAAGRLHDGAGPLRLEGRFFTNVPWPLRDLPRAERVLLEALAAAPGAFPWLFLGDLRWRQGRPADARACWESSAGAEPTPALRLFDPLASEEARQRLAATAR